MKQNSCLNRKNPRNCLDCVGYNDGCTASADNGFSVPYSCEKGQHWCCTASNIEETDFDKPEKYGMCAMDCIEDGSPVSMNMYPNQYSSKQTDSDIEDYCCSGEAHDVTAMSGVGLDEEGREVFSGSIDGVCGAGEATAMKIG